MFIQRGAPVPWHNGTMASPSLEAQHASEHDEQIAVIRGRFCCSCSELQKNEIITDDDVRSRRKMKQQSVSGSAGVTLISHVDLTPRIDDNGIYRQVTWCVRCRPSDCHWREHIVLPVSGQYFA